jgi:DNA-binding helix-hairpin-helix protein with protein kinase domain
MMQLSLAHARTSIHLGQELGRGGEGAVFAIDSRNDLVAKIYSVPPDAKKIQKLAAMTEAASPLLLRIAAWPVDLLTDIKGAVRGFVMPRIIARRDIHELYSPKSRSEAFPETDFRFLVHVGANIARAFAVVHAQGHVLGDINHGNLLVGPDGTVMLIDCDSFQIGTRAQMYTCDVGVPLFTAPELHRRPLRGLTRTANHDRFGLAVLLFHLLYMGRHPFAGKFSGQGDMPIEKAIAEYRFAYGPDRGANGMERPPGTVPLEAMGTSIRDLFIRAFERSGNYEGRPDAEKWINALENLESNLRVCSTASWHHYPGELRDCPWCEIEVQTGIRLFGQRITVDHATGGVDLATLWRAIAAVPSPNADPPLPSERPWYPPQGVTLPSSILKKMRKAISIGLTCTGLVACNAFAKEGGGLWAIASYGLAVAVWPRVSAEQRAVAERAYSAARAEWESVLNRWKQEASLDTFNEKLNGLDKARTELTGLPQKRQRGLAKLESEREARQRQRYLDRFRIDRAEIRGIGAGRTSMLASYGIETAADINKTKILQIPGFGEALTSELVEWRKKHERNFRFNPNEPVDRHEIDVMDRDLESQQQNLLSTLRQGSDSLRRISQEITAARSRLMPILDKTWTALKVAEAHRDALP